MFQRLSFVLSFLLVIIDFLSAFPVDFAIQVLGFCSFFFLGKKKIRFFYKLISLLHRLVRLILGCLLRYVSIIRLFFSVSSLIVVQFIFLRDGNVVFFSYIIV